MRGPSANGSARGSSPTSSTGVMANAANYIKPQVNRQIADFGLQSKTKQNNIGNQGIPGSRKFNPATAVSCNDGANPFDDERSEYSYMSMP